MRWLTILALLATALHAGEVEVLEDGSLYVENVGDCTCPDAFRRFMEVDPVE